MVSWFKSIYRQMFNQYFIILHIPTGKYLHTVYGMYDMAPIISLDNDPTYYYYSKCIGLKQQKLHNMISDLVIYEADIDEATDYSVWVKKKGYDFSEFEIIRVKYKDIK